MHNFHWLERRFWNQTFEQELEPKKNQNPEQEVQVIRQLFDEENTKVQEEPQC